ncbi:MAG: PEP-CTERM sorting domain-containing protein [Bryobacteraceae bacterium]
MIRILSLLCATAALAFPGTVISVSSSPNVFLGGIGAVSWTQSGSFNNVEVTAQMSNQSGVGQSLSFHAYLTDAIGATATVADEIASLGFSLAPGLNQTVNLFSGLTLGPGTYFLVISPDAGVSGIAGWAAINSAPTVTLGSGVTRNADRGSSGAIASYPPSTVIPLLTGGSLLYDVTTVDSAVPEPATTALIGAGLAILASYRRRSK